MTGGRTLSNVKESPFSRDSDNFALAVHIFQLLMNSAHPFACAKSRGSNVITAVPQPPQNIVDGKFPFMQKIPGITTPLYAPSIDIFPNNIQLLFKKAFIAGHKNKILRPKANDWFLVLSNLELNLTQCRKNSTHQYYNKLKSCLLCKADEAYKNI